MERSSTRNPAVRVALVSIALGLVVLASTSQVGQAIGAAACHERAQYELISCVATPEVWLMIVTGGLAVGFAILLGFLLAVRRGTGRDVDPSTSE